MMKAKEVQQARADLGLNQTEFAEALGITSRRAVSYWESGERRLAGPAEILLRLLMKRPALLDEIKDIRDKRKGK